MKKVCLNCGEELLLCSQKRKFCSKECREKFRKEEPKKRTIANSFALFKNIVASSETPQEFKKFWREYFGEK